MTDMRNLRIGSRLIVGFGLILTILVAVLAIGNISNGSNRAELVAGMKAAHAKNNLAAAMKNALLQQGIAMRNVGLQSDLAAMQKEAAKAQDENKRYLEARAQLIAAGLSQEERAILDEIAKLDKALEASFKEAIQHAFLFNDIETGKVIRGRIDPLNRQAVAEIEKLVAAQQANVRKILADSADAQRKLTYLIVLMGVIALAAGGLLAVLLTRSITVPLRRAVEVAEKVASGELTARVKADGKDEIGDLLRALKDMNESLLGIVGKVRAATGTITGASAEIATGNADLSSRTETQAGSLQETAASMEQLTSTVRQNADNARQANQLVLSASGYAAKGGQVVGQAVDTMDSIKKSSNRIADIIGVIDGIAFQTNILALNAAVEAARAGEQGRGFAVVAAEVRNLAQRSAGAAKEIKSLIGESVEKVDAGSTLVNEAGKTMSEIVASVKHVADIMGEIAAASQEQSAGIGEVNQSVAQMDEMTQRNAALVRQAAAAAESMQEQAMQLAQAVRAFKLEGDKAEATRPAMVLGARPGIMRLTAE